MQKLPHRIFVRQLLLFGFDMYPQSVVFFVRDSGCAVRPAHTPQIKKKTPPDKLGEFFFMPVVGVEPTRVISTRDFEFWGGFSIWCHLVIFKVI